MGGRVGRADDPRLLDRAQAFTCEIQRHDREHDRVCQSVWGSIELSGASLRELVGSSCPYSQLSVTQVRAILVRVHLMLITLLEHWAW